MINSFTSLFLKQLVIQSGLAATSAQKAVVSCPSGMCHCILLWYLQIPASVPCWLQASSVNQTCTLLSQLSQSLSHSSLVSITVQYLTNVCLRVTWSFILLNLLSILSAFAQIRLCLIPRFFGFGLGKRYAAVPCWQIACVKAMSTPSHYATSTYVILGAAHTSETNRLKHVAWNMKYLYDATNKYILMEQRTLRNKKHMFLWNLLDAVKQIAWNMLHEIWNICMMQQINIFQWNWWYRFFNDQSNRVSKNRCFYDFLKFDFEWSIVLKSKNQSLTPRKFFRMNFNFE